MEYIYIYINIFSKKLQFAAYGQFVLVFINNCELQNKIVYVRAW